MALDNPRCYYSDLVSVTLAAGQALSEEGQALVMSTTEADAVQISAGTAGEVFVGFAYADSINHETHARQESATIAADNTISLKKNNLVADQIQVVDSTGTALTEVATITGATEFSVDDSTGIVTFDASLVGDTMTVYYRYTLLTTEAKQLFQQSLSSQTAVSDSGLLMAMQGTGLKVFTTMYDLSSGVFALGDVVYLGAGGLLTKTATGTEVGRVIEAPAVSTSATGAYLGVLVPSAPAT